jgi:hypothetical protein
MRHSKQQIAKPLAQDAVTLKLRNGGLVTLPRVEIGKDEDGPVTITDFSSIDPCHRCDTEAQPDGSLPSGGGILRVYAIHRGVWTAYAGACDCVFGAWRAVPHKYKIGSTWSITPAMRYVDDLPGVPPGLSNSDWTLLNLYKQPGDGYQQAAQRVPPGDPGASKPARLIRAWMPGLASIPGPDPAQAEPEAPGPRGHGVTQFELAEAE